MRAIIDRPFSRRIEPDRLGRLDRSPRRPRAPKACKPWVIDNAIGEAVAPEIGRKNRMLPAIILDRSGSMKAPYRAMIFNGSPQVVFDATHIGTAAPASNNKQ